jgi:ribose/xylose/arabinose/galactoside ABC-type transport system permease subunit
MVFCLGFQDNSIEQPVCLVPMLCFYYYSSVVKFEVSDCNNSSISFTIQDCFSYYSWLLGWLVGWLVGWWVGGLVGWWVGWLVGWWVGWLVDWLVCKLT